MIDWEAQIRNPLDPDVDYTFLYDFILWVNYGWITEPSGPIDEEAVR